MTKEPPFILFKPTSWLSGDEWDTLLGAVVKNFWAPTENSVPAEPLIYNKGRKFVEKGFNDFVLNRSDGRGISTVLKLKGLANLTWKGEVDDGFNLEGKHIRYIKLRQHDKFWEALKENPDFRTTVPEWLGSIWKSKSRIPVCLITGLFICEDVTLVSSTESGQERGIGVEAPLGTAAAAAAFSQGLPLPSDGTGNLEASFEPSRTRQQTLNAEDRGSSIFALQLKVVSSKAFDRKALRLQDSSPDVPIHRQMGEDEKLPSVTSLTLENMDPEAWLAIEETSNEKPLRFA